MESYTDSRPTTACRGRATAALRLLLRAPDAGRWAARRTKRGRAVSCLDCEAEVAVGSRYCTACGVALQAPRPSPARRAATQAAVAVPMVIATPLIAGIVSPLVGPDAPITYPSRVALSYLFILLASSIPPIWRSDGSSGRKFAAWGVGSSAGVLTYHVLGGVWSIALVAGLQHLLSSPESLPAPGLFLPTMAIGSSIPPLAGVAMATWSATRMSSPRAA